MKNAVIFVGILMLVSCAKPTLTDTEIKIINKNIAQKIYESNVENAIDPQSLYDDLWECVHAVAKKEEKEAEAFYNNPFTGMFSALATFTGEDVGDKYSNFVDYCNDHQDYLLDAVNEVVEVFKKNPGLNAYGEGEGIHLDLREFSHIYRMPQSVDDEAANVYAMKRITPENKVQFGRYLMGTANHPNYAPQVVVGQALVRMGHQKFPRPVYAVYDDEDGTWDVGYDCERAVTILFEKKKHSTSYEFGEIKYYPFLISSPDNVLNKKQKKNRRSA
ncbi:MAG: hypothetical protein K2M19_01935 [Muribaculaceae bacterium]|nr:hypothetical protein [Muribaculaceae bacterium]